MNNGSFNLPFPFTPTAAFLLPSQQQHLPNNHHPGNIVNLTGNVANASGNQIASSGSSHTSESSQGSSPGTRNGRESRENNSNPGPSNATGTNHQQQTNWSYEEQFRQVRKASTIELSLLQIYYVSFPNFYSHDLSLEVLVLFTRLVLNFKLWQVTILFIYRIYSYIRWN